MLPRFAFVADDEVGTALEAFLRDRRQFLEIENAVLTEAGIDL